MDFQRQVDLLKLCEKARITKDDLPACRGCGGRPLVLGDPHTDWLIVCEHDCGVSAFDTYRVGAIATWIGENSVDINGVLAQLGERLP